MPVIGVLMLHTRFPRPVGDIGHALSWQALGLNPLFRVVTGAHPQQIVRRESTQQWLCPFVQAAQELIAQGAQAITTSCGFLEIGRAHV